MAKAPGVWGIDIGQSALKALRCRVGETDSQIVADAFDFIEYPQILSQPDANPAELINEALTQFLSRNDIRGDKVVISVSGQNGLARFIKLPPVESSKIPDIVKYEARQQIPFPLDEVVWDYQQMSGGATDEGFALETEVGLFAMRRDQVYKTLEAFDKVDIEVDVIQLTPLALYNFIVFDQMRALPREDEYDPDNPPDSIVVLSMGTDTTDLVVTNGFRVWQRSIPVGGNHFTKAMVKELKMNFGTAEHLKRNASQAEDPKALFQAMRPVFNDLLTEVQRSIGYFKNMDRKANISRVVALGNVMKLPGLQRYLTQNLGFELARVEDFRGLAGDEVVNAPAFKENLLAYGVCYGLALQGLNRSKVRTNLLPREILQDRMIRAKKPWALAAAAALLLVCGLGFVRWEQAVRSASTDSQAEDRSTSFAGAIQQSNSLMADGQTWRDGFEAVKTKLTKTDEVGRSLLQNTLGRDRYVSLLKAINLCLPRNEGERPKELDARNEIKIDSIQCVWVPKLEDWYASVRQWDKDNDKAAAGLPADAPVDPNAPVAVDPAIDPGFVDPAAQAATEVPPGPTGPGWVFSIRGHHYHNSDPSNQGVQFVRETFLAKLKENEVPLPPAQAPAGMAAWPVKELGIHYPVLVGQPLIDQNFMLPVDEEGMVEEPVQNGPMNMGQPAAATHKKKVFKRLDFVVQFCWQPLNEGLQGAPTGEGKQDGQMAAN